MLSLHALQGNLMDCADAGPWACIVEGCPAPELGCVELAELGFCTSRFDEVWEPPPPGTKGALVAVFCPNACGRCGKFAPVDCNMQVINADTLSAASLADTLQVAETPIIIRTPPKAEERPLSAMKGLLAAYGTLPLNVIVAGGRVRGEETEELAMVMEDYSVAMRAPHL
jgi:hypothetical protein